MRNNYGRWVKQRREKLGLSMREFGKLVGISHAHVSNIENGKVENIRRPTRLAIVTAINAEEEKRQRNG